MKQGWKLKPLKDFLKVQNGYAFNSKLFNDIDGVPLVRIRDLKNGKNTEVKYVGEYDPKYLVKKGNLLIGMDGEFRCYEWTGDDALLNQRVCRLQDFDHNLLPKFLFYGINKYLKDIEDVTSYTTVKHISSKQIKEIPFPIPPLEEQKRIVAKLDQCFEVIDKVRANVEKNLNNAKELFQSKLNEIFSQKGDGLEQKKLSEVAEVIAGQSPRGEFYNDKGNGLPFYQGKKLFGERYLNEPNVWTSMTTKESYQGDIVMSVRAPVGDVNFNNHKIICIGRGLAAIRAKETTNKEYLFYFLIHHKNEIVGNTGAVFNSINKTQISNIPIPIVDLNKQNQIVKKLNKLKSQTQALELKYQQELDALDELKKSILQKAFNGEL